MKTLFTAEVISKGGRSDTLGNPLKKGRETRRPNPESLFAGAFSDCYHCAEVNAAKKLGTPIEDSTVRVFVSLVKDETAITLANDSDYVLGGSVFTQEVTCGMRVASRIDTGIVFVNYPTRTAADLPFGGIKNSGYVRELSSLGIQEYFNKKLIPVATTDASHNH